MLGVQCHHIGRSVSSDDDTIKCVTIEIMMWYDSVTLSR